MAMTSILILTTIVAAFVCLGLFWLGANIKRGILFATASKAAKRTV
jgi:hypothetical protein